MAFHVFKRENVNCAIVEVGIGGEFDATNIVESCVAGIGSLGIDHVSMLGDTIDKIAWHKAGIFKAGCDAVYVEQRTESCMKVIEERAAEKRVITFFYIVQVDILFTLINAGCVIDFCV